MNKEEFQMLSFYRDRGMVPDWYWYQVNGQSPIQNFEEQRRKIYDRINYGYDWEPMNIKFTFESKLKK